MDLVSISARYLELGEDICRQVQVGPLGTDGENEGPKSFHSDRVSLTGPHREGWVEGGRLS